MRQNPSSHFVAFFDMLGVADLTMRRPEIAWEALSQLAKQKMRIRALGILDTNSGEALNERIFDFTFSDSIIMMTRGDDDLDLRAILITSLELFLAAFAASIPLRGAIAVGRFLFNVEHSLFSGPPLIQAYRLGEEQQWLGVTVDSLVAARYASLAGSFHCGGVPLIADWDVPIRGEQSRRRSVLDWPRTHRSNWKVEPPIPVAAFYQAFEQLFGPLSELSPEARRKYENTTEFVNRRLGDGGDSLSKRRNGSL